LTAGCDALSKKMYLGYNKQPKCSADISRVMKEYAIDTLQRRACKICYDKNPIYLINSNNKLIETLM
jgi:hypothetical protein